jgi:hypothetical protein
MSFNLSSVLISDEVDQKCVDILQENGIKVVKNTKLSKEDLLKEIAVSILFLCKKCVLKGDYSMYTCKSACSEPLDHVLKRCLACLHVELFLEEKYEQSPCTIVVVCCNNNLA